MPNILQRDIEELESYYHSGDFVGYDCCLEYDNGNCLNNKWDDETMKKVLMDPGIMENESYKRICGAEE